MELVSAALWPAPWVAYLLATAAVGALGITSFADLLRTLGVRSWLPTTVALAAVPMIVRADVTFMDYTWSLAALLLGLALYARGHLAAPGVLAATSVAFRPAAIVLLIVFASLLFLQHRSLKDWNRFVMPCAIVAIIFFALPLIVSGPQIFTADTSSAEISRAVSHLSTGAWGWLGAPALLCAGFGVLVTLINRFHKRRRKHTSPWLWGAGAGIAAQLVEFLLIPLEDGYLCPLAPLSLLAIAITLPTLSIWWLAAAFTVSSLWAPFSLGTTLPTDHHERAVLAKQSYDRLNQLRSSPPDTSLVVGPALPEIVARAEWPAFAGDERVVPHTATSPDGKHLLYSD